MFHRFISKTRYAACDTNPESVSAWWFGVAREEEGRYQRYGTEVRRHCWAMRHDEVNFSRLEGCNIYAEGQTNNAAWKESMMAYEMIVRVFQDGNEICALTGADLMAGTAGFGATVSSALRSLAD